MSTDLEITKRIIIRLNGAIENAADSWDMETPEEALAFANMSMARNGAMNRYEKLMEPKKGKK